MTILFLSVDRSLVNNCLSFVKCLSIVTYLFWLSSLGLEVVKSGYQVGVLRNVVFKHFSKFIDYISKVGGFGVVNLKYSGFERQPNCLWKLPIRGLATVRSAILTRSLNDSGPVSGDGRTCRWRFPFRTLLTQGSYWDE